MNAAVARAEGLRAAGGQHVGVVGAGMAIAALTIAAAVMGASAPGDDQAMAATLRAALVAAPLVTAWYAADIGYGRFATLLAATGCVGFITTLSESTDPTAYSIGRVGGWLHEIMLVALLLTFPSGRLLTPLSRWLVAAMVAVVALLYLPTLPLADHFRVPSPYTSCTAGCPRNVFFALDQPPAGLTSALVGAGSLLIFVVMLGVLVRLQQCVATARPVERQMLMPVLAVGMVRAGLVGGLIVARDLGSLEAVPKAGAWLIAWTTPAIAIAFLVGVVRSRLFAERVIRRLTVSVGRGPDVERLESAFRYALDDTSVGIVFPREGGPDRWMDARGAPFPLATLDDQHALHVIHGRQGTTVAALICDTTLAQRPELLNAVAGLAAVALDNVRLGAEAEASALEANESRARIAAAADRERRRIERDLHDGAQQRLVALRIELALLEDLARSDPDRCAERLRELEGDVEDALEELRALAHGVCPPLLADRGLGDALQAAVSRSAVPVSLHCSVSGRYTPEIESAIYFSILEALQNVSKHASSARRAVVRLTRQDDELRFSVCDDGPGARQSDLANGAGVVNMHDRVAAIGGWLTLTSRLGQGTEVRGVVPVGPAA